jgi:hypothetical protein
MNKFIAPLLLGCLAVPMEAKALELLPPPPPTQTIDVILSLGPCSPLNEFCVTDLNGQTPANPPPGANDFDVLWDFQGNSYRKYTRWSWDATILNSPPRFNNSSIYRDLATDLLPPPPDTSTFISGKAWWTINGNPPPVPVPGPLPLLGVGVAFGYARQLRRKVRPLK